MPMAEHPLPFTVPVMKLYLAGKKTQTRRPIRFKHCRTFPPSEIRSIHQDGGGNWVGWDSDAPDLAELTKLAYPNGEGFKCPWGKPGDHLWIREAIRHRVDVYQGMSGATYSTDLSPVMGAGPAGQYCGRALVNWKWKHNVLSAMHMPRWASRSVPELLKVRVQWVQDISASDAVAEGIDVDQAMMRLPTTVDLDDPILRRETAVYAFSVLWDAIYAKQGYGWDDNPWVWVLEFPPYR